MIIDTYQDSTKYALADVDDQLPVLDRSNTLDLISTTYFARASSSDAGKLLFRVYAHTQGNKLLFQVLAPVTMANIFLFVLIHEKEVNYEILSGVLFVLVFGYSVRPPSHSPHQTPPPHPYLHVPCSRRQRHTSGAHGDPHLHLHTIPARRCSPGV